MQSTLGDYGGKGSVFAMKRTWGLEIISQKFLKTIVVENATEICSCGVIVMSF